jgi:NitT/TauT family transport system substrate-binding protein
MIQTRRRFLTTLSAAGAAGLVRAPQSRAAEGAIETTTVLIGKTAAICLAPLYVSEELLRAEGFTDIRFVDAEAPTIGQTIGRGDVHFSAGFVGNFIEAVDAGAPIVMVAGLHVGCYELFAQEDIRLITDLKGKQVAADNPELFNLIAGQLGIDPATELQWATGADRSANRVELFAQGKIAAYLAFPPAPQELRARHLGHVIVDTAMDRPWSQYFCCMLTGNREFVRNHPVATKRATRAILKAADLCANQPERVAKRIVDRGFTPRYDYTLQTLNDVPYDKWREYDPEDTIRYYALRLHENAAIKSTPQQIIAGGTDWHFLDEIKRELKA